MSPRIEDRPVGVFEGTDVPPIGALVMASFAEIHAPITAVKEAERENRLDLGLRPPNVKDALALVLRNVEKTFANDIARDRTRNPNVESLTWDATPTGSREYVLHRVALVSNEKGRLQQPNIARIWVEDGSNGEPVLRSEIYDTRVFDSDARLVATLKKLVSEWREFVNAQRIRNAWSDLLRSKRAVPWMPRGIGGLSFVPNDGLDAIDRFGKFLKSVAKYRTTSYDFALRYVAVWDTREVRESLLRDVEDEVNARLDSIAEKAARDVLEADDAKRLEKLLERRLASVSEALDIQTNYESLLKSKIALRDRLVAPKLLAEAEKKIETSGAIYSERAKALFLSIVSREGSVSKEAK